MAAKILIPTTYLVCLGYFYLRGSWNTLSIAESPIVSTQFSPIPMNIIVISKWTIPIDDAMIQLAMFN